MHTHVNCPQYEEKSSMCSYVLRNFLAFAHCEETTTIIFRSAENLVNLNKMHTLSCILRNSEQNAALLGILGSLG